MAAGRDASNMTHNQRLGKFGESLAVEYLLDRGYSILKQNWRSPYGELDIVAMKDNRIIFMEVKTRTSLRFGWPEEAITSQKQEHLWNCGEAFLDAFPEYTVLPWQIDVLAILIESQVDRKYQIKHYENAVTEL
jgi:putative endonuclease